MKPDPPNIDARASWSAARPPKHGEVWSPLGARSRWTAPVERMRVDCGGWRVLCRFAMAQRASKSARGLAQSKTWRQCVAALGLLVALFAQVSLLRAQLGAPN